MGSLRGRVGVAGLLAVAARLNWELTGRENIYLHASILGLTRREINRNFDSIVEFSGLEQFIDNQVKHYSSGQYVRLGFAIAVHVDPDVLLVDEVLAVGDEAFQAKCLAKITEFQERGCTILFVTHAVDLVPRLCSRGLVLDHGRVLHDGDALEAAERLRTLLGTAPDQSGGAAGASSALRISGVRMVDPSARAAHKGEFQVGEPLAVEVDVAVGAEPPPAAVVRVAVTGPADVPMWVMDAEEEHFEPNGTWTVRFFVKELPPIQGIFALAVALREPATPRRWRPWSSLATTVASGAGSPAGAGLGTFLLLGSLNGPGDVDQAVLAGADHPQGLAEAASVQCAAPRLAQGDRQGEDPLDRRQLLDEEADGPGAVRLEVLLLGVHHPHRHVRRAGHGHADHRRRRWLGADRDVDLDGQWLAHLELALVSGPRAGVDHPHAADPQGAGGTGRAARLVGRGAEQGPQPLGGLQRVAVVQHSAVVEHQAAAAEPRHQVHGVGDEQDGAAPLLELGDLGQALGLEGLVAHGQHLVDQQDVGVHVHRDREAEPHVLAGRVVLDLVVDELLEA